MEMNVFVIKFSSEIFKQGNTLLLCLLENDLVAT